MVVGSLQCEKLYHRIAVLGRLRSTGLEVEMQEVPCWVQSACSGFILLIWTSPQPVGLSFKSFPCSALASRVIHIIIIERLHMDLKNQHANIQLNGEKLKIISLASRTRQSRPLSPHLVNKARGVLAKAARQPKEIKGYRLKRRESKCCDLQILW